MGHGLELLRRMIYYRAVEETIAGRYAEQEIRCPTHLSIGQEGPAAAAGMVLRTTDYAVSTHRGHAHYLAKGGNLDAMIAELYGKVTGCARGRGGSMHLVDTSVGFMGTTAIVGNSIPIGVGLGLAARLDGGDAVSCVFLGDAATETGAFYEAANFAATRRLPVLFLCENNLYSVYSPLPVRQPQGRRLFEMARGIGLEAMHGDGNDPEAALALVTEAVSGLRAGGKPCFVELDTYRWREHCGPNYDNHIGYRTEAEFLAWKERDPIAALSRTLLAAGALTGAALETIREEIGAMVSRAFERARSAAFPAEAEAFADEYAPT